jgi:hypothetical protein
LAASLFTEVIFHAVISSLSHPNIPLDLSLDICLALSYFDRSELSSENMIADSIRHTPGLDMLQSAKQRHLLDTIDKLRNCGLDSELSLPQLVVCGDQSSGKLFTAQRL